MESNSMSYVDESGANRTAAPRAAAQLEGSAPVYDLPLGAHPAECAEPRGYPVYGHSGPADAPAAAPIGVHGWTKGHRPGVGPTWACPHCVRVFITRREAEQGLHVFVDGGYAGTIRFPLLAQHGAP